ncbi:MAG: manganese efflux pump [Oscillospiraceae bacterium]|nr:manganese efflux pump [Oscillospiraceae bacterium]
MLEIILLITAVSVDGFVSAVGISSAGIKIPFGSAMVISLIGTMFLGAAVFFSDVIAENIPGDICRSISAFLLGVLGILNFFHGIISVKSKSEKCPEAVKLYFDGTKADRDSSKTISCAEAVFLAAALSADSLVTGIGAGLDGISIIPLVLFSIVIGIISICGGAYIGRHVIFTGKINLQWIGGILLIVLALMK